MNAAPADGAPAVEEVDLALVIVTDVSYSVDPNEARFQRQGAVAAFRSPEVVKAIQSGSLGRIAVAYVDFGDSGRDRLIADWHVIHDKASAEAFADALARPRLTSGTWTSISSGLELAAKLLETSGFAGTRRVIDVSGDGANNDGRRVDAVRDEIIAKGITINGLPIMTEADRFDPYYIPDLDQYYAGCVIGGPGAFLQVAQGFEDLARAIRRKLILEISDAGATEENDLLIRVGASASNRRSPARFVYERGCDIGERMRFGPARAR